MCANTDLQKKIHKKLEMTYVGEIYVDTDNKNGGLRFSDIPREFQEKTCLVYIWVRCSGKCKPSEVMYVGMAGGTLSARFAQHLGGFRGGSGPGKRLADNIREVLKGGDEICIYARASPPITLWGQEVCSNCVEERAIIRLLEPAWNKQK